MLKEMGRSKPKKHYKKIKCSKCGADILIIEENIEKFSGVKYIVCEVCGNEEIIK